ncbi:MAG: hypothetical protein LKF54_00135 [Bacilli bacterium]|jgi:hypothetical protein|nr:hypothetical protein [Bacilli bacterium]
MAKNEVQVLSPTEITKIAQELSTSPLDKQTSIIVQICAKSIVNGVKVVIETLEIIKKANEDTNKGNKQFLTLCEKGIDTLKTSIASGEISEEEKKDVNTKIMDILIMANDNSNKAMDNTKYGVKKAIEVGGTVIGGIAAWTIFLLISKEIVKSLKK